MKKSFTKDILCQLPEEGGGAWQMLNIADEWGGRCVNTKIFQARNFKYSIFDIQHSTSNI